MKPLYILNLKSVTILEQLQIEEALMRADDRNWCLINSGVSPAIVLGISSKSEQWIDHDRLKSSPIPVIRRFSGGGTVVVDQNTLFVSFICNEGTFPNHPTSKEILTWSGGIYSEVFDPLPFSVQENDYAIGDRKVGGNAQYLRKARWLHHSSFLWDFHPERMAYLRQPPKMPAYRHQRGHFDFLCKMKDHFTTQEIFFDRLMDTLASRFVLQQVQLPDLSDCLLRPHRRATIVER